MDNRFILKFGKVLDKDIRIDNLNQIVEGHANIINENDIKVWAFDWVEKNEGDFRDWRAPEWYNEGTPDLLESIMKAAIQMDIWEKAEINND